MALFGSLFGKKETSVVGIDIGSSSIKVVQLSRKAGKAVLDTYGELALGPYAGIEIGRATTLQVDKISEALKDVMKEAKITTTQCGLAIPYNSSLIALIELPAAAEKQLGQIVPLEARKYVPVPISEVSLDWTLIPRAADAAVGFADEEEKKKKDELIDVLLVAIHTEALSRNQTIVTQSALNASFFEIEIFSTLRAVLDQDIATQMIVDLGAATTKVYVVERGIVRTSHVINRGSQDVTIALATALGVSMQEAEIIKRDLTRIPDMKVQNATEIIGLTLDYIFSEANRVLTNYQRKFNKDIAKVTMVGGGARLQGVLPIAEGHFQTHVVLGDPFGKAEAPAFLEEVLKNTGPEFAVAVGVALRRLQELGA